MKAVSDSALHTIFYTLQVLLLGPERISFSNALHTTQLANQPAVMMGQQNQAKCAMLPGLFQCSADFSACFAGAGCSIHGLAFSRGSPMAQLANQAAVQHNEVADSGKPGEPVRVEEHGAEGRPGALHRLPDQPCSCPHYHPVHSELFAAPLPCADSLQRPLQTRQCNGACSCQGRLERHALIPGRLALSSSRWC